MNCLWCDAVIVPEISWQNLMDPPKSRSLCQSCADGLLFLSGNRCQICSRMSDDDVCRDCKWWKRNTVTGDDPLTRNFSIFHYNDVIQEMISRWKFRGDYCLGNAFMPYFSQAFQQQYAELSEDALIVPIPLSNERICERGFNQSRMLATFLPRDTGDVLYRIHSEKQSKKTRSERISAVNPFHMNETINKPVILVDDIYTTGSTLRHAAEILKANGCSRVYALTLIHG